MYWKDKYFNQRFGCNLCIERLKEAIAKSVHKNFNHKIDRDICIEGIKDFSGKSVF